jgi:hypothetical protein
MKLGEIDKRVDGNDAYFTIAWSPYAKADKYEIVRSVPAIGGIVELYYMDEYRKLNLYSVARSYYGGLRAVLREMTDPILERDERRRSILEAHKGGIWYRWAHTESQDDMNDILFFFMETYVPGICVVDPSGRYDTIYVQELDAEKVVHVR